VRQAGGRARARRSGEFGRWLASTSNRTFIAWPLAVTLVEVARRRGRLAAVPAAAPLLAWGYLQYRWAGRYRTRRGGGGPGMSVPPERLVTTGPYALTRNPMYLGHLIFLGGLALTLRSWPAAALLGAHLPWFDRRAREDEAQLGALFGGRYEGYARRVPRWVPGVR